MGCLPLHDADEKNLQDDVAKKVAEEKERQETLKRKREEARAKSDGSRKDWEREDDPGFDVPENWVVPEGHCPDLDSTRKSEYIKWKFAELCAEADERGLENYSPAT